MRTKSMVTQSYQYAGAEVLVGESICVRAGGRHCFVSGALHFGCMWLVSKRSILNTEIVKAMSVVHAQRRAVTISHLCGHKLNG